MRLKNNLELAKKQTENNPIMNHEDDVRMPFLWLAENIDKFAFVTEKMHVTSHRKSQFFLLSSLKFF